MSKKTYVATFPDGTTIARGTKRVYTHAWRTVDRGTGRTVASGFSAALI